MMMPTMIAMAMNSPIQNSGCAFSGLRLRLVTLASLILILSGFLAFAAYGGMVRSRKVE